MTDRSAVGCDCQLTAASLVPQQTLLKVQRGGRQIFEAHGQPKCD